MSSVSGGGTSFPSGALSGRPPTGRHLLEHGRDVRVAVVRDLMGVNVLGGFSLENVNLADGGPAESPQPHPGANRVSPGQPAGPGPKGNEEQSGAAGAAQPGSDFGAGAPCRWR